MRSGTNTHTGFTLPELLVTVAIIGILIAFAAPMMSESVAKRRVYGDYKSIRDVLRMAKSAGMTEKVEAVIICPGNAGGCESGDWRDGFIAFADVDDSGNFSTDDVVVAVQDELSQGTTLTVTDENSGSATVSSITLTGEGYTADFNASTAPIYLFTYCNSGSDERVAMGVVYGPGGVIRMTHDTDDDGIANYGVANLSCE